MAGTKFRGRLNPVVMPRSGGFIPSDSSIKQIGKWAKALEPRRTPVLSRCKQSGTVNQMKNEWGQSYRREIQGNLGAAVANNATTVNVGTGNGALLQQWHVLEIIDYADAAHTRLDYTSREEVIVNDNTNLGGWAPAGTDTPTVIRDVENRTDASTPASGAWPTHDSGAHWAICGVAMPHNKAFNISPITRGSTMFNFSQRFYGAVAADLAARRTPTYEHPTDQMLADFKEEQINQKHFLERALVSGTRMEGDGTTLPYKMGGIKYLIQTYAPAANQINCSGQPLSAMDMEFLLRTMFKNLDDGGAKTVLMGPDTAAIIDTMLNPYREASMRDTGANLFVEELKFRWGTIEIQPTLHMPEGDLLFVDFGKISVKNYAGLDWQTKKIETDGPFDQMAIFGEFTCEIDEIGRFGRIHNFSLNPDHYDHRSFM